MFRKTFALLTFIAALAGVSAFAQAQDKQGKAKGGPPPPQPQAVQMVKPGFFVIAGAGGNTGVRVTKAGLIVVDTKNEGDVFYNELSEKIKSISPEPVKFVIVTHHHQDHSGNIQKFLDAGAQVIATENLKTNLVTYAPPQGKPGSPSITYAKDYTVKLGGVKVVAHYYGPAHTSGDTIVYYPDLKIVQTGDVVVGVAPNIDFPFGGSALSWQKVLDKISKLDFDTLVPGHSAQGQLLMTKADFLAYKMKFDTLITRAEEVVKKGATKDQFLAQIKTDDLGWNVNGPPWNQPARVDAFYAELQKAK